MPDPAPDLAADPDHGTHEVTNQPGPPPPRDPWADDVPLREAAAAAGADGAPLAAYGAALAGGEIRAAARAAERHPPERHRFDRAGRRIDEVEFHPGYHALLDL
ncbi:MAG: DNA alkylation response protein, partial [Paracoccaceae bacterium]|nr:DNA alkylation response protein [Paracoccaceae bacterium]